MSSVLSLGSYRAAQLVSTTILALLFGSTTCASAAVMPCLVAAPLSTYAKLSVFRSFISRAHAMLCLALLSTVAPLGFLAYGTSLSSAKRNHLIALGAIVGALGLQVPVLPRYRQMGAVVNEGRGKNDDGKEGNWMIGKLWRLNLGRVVLTGAAFMVEVWEMLPKRDGVPLPVHL